MDQQIVSNITKKRLVGELKLLNEGPLELIDTYPDDKDALLWYFLLRGPDFTEYKGGFYIGKVLHDPEYPKKGPNYMMLTPSGRFDIEKKICLTNSGYHAEQWSPIWNMKTILLGFLSIMADDLTTGISHIKKSPEERKQLAKESVAYNMTFHKDKWLKFERFVNPDGTPRSDEEIKLLSVPKIKKNKAEQKTNESKTEPKTEQKTDENKTESKTEQKADETKTEQKTEQKANESKTEQKPEQKADEVVKQEQKLEQNANESKTEPKVVNEIVKIDQKCEHSEPSEASCRRQAWKVNDVVIIEHKVENKTEPKKSKKLLVKSKNISKKKTYLYDIDTFDFNKYKFDINKTDQKYNEIINSFNRLR